MPSSLLQCGINLLLCFECKHTQNGTILVLFLKSHAFRWWLLSIWLTHKWALEMRRHLSNSIPQLAGQPSIDNRSTVTKSNLDPSHLMIFSLYSDSRPKASCWEYDLVGGKHRLVWRFRSFRSVIVEDGRNCVCSIEDQKLSSAQNWHHLIFSWFLVFG